MGYSHIFDSLIYKIESQFLFFQLQPQLNNALKVKDKCKNRIQISTCKFDIARSCSVFKSHTQAYKTIKIKKLQPLKKRNKVVSTNISSTGKHKVCDAIKNFRSSFCLDLPGVLTMFSRKLIGQQMVISYLLICSLEFCSKLPW